jgi:hypothetical protein
MSAILSVPAALRNGLASYVACSYRTLAAMKAGLVLRVPEKLHSKPLDNAESDVVELLPAPVPTRDP